MTAKQRANRERFKKVVAEAKKLRKKNPKLTQAQAVKKAWAVFYNKPIGAVKSKPKPKPKTKRKVSSEYHKDQKSHNVNISVVSGFFDTSAIDSLDKLKKEYLKLAKKYHPDAGGTTVQFQDLQNEYEKLLNKILKGSSLNEEQRENEIVIDQAIRAVIDQLVNLENINVDLIGKWLWVSGDTYPIKDVLKKAGLIFIRKDEKPFWVYKGVESAGRGKLTLEQIKNKYGSVKIDLPKQKRLSGFVRINKTKLLASFRKLMKGLNKRPV